MANMFEVARCPLLLGFLFMPARLLLCEMMERYDGYYLIFTSYFKEGNCLEDLELTILFLLIRRMGERSYKAAASTQLVTYQTSHYYYVTDIYYVLLIACCSNYSKIIIIRKIIINT